MAAVKFCPCKFGVSQACDTNVSVDSGPGKPEVHERNGHFDPPYRRRRRTLRLA